MDSNPAPQISVHRNLIDAIIMNNVIEANRSLSEGLLVAFEGCEANGFPLTQVQKQEIMQCLIFCARNNEQEMTANANFMLNMQQAYNEGDIDLDIDTEDSV
jgi:uncharacterized protein YeaC (DUF1315 family)